MLSMPQVIVILFLLSKEIMQVSDSLRFCYTLALPSTLEVGPLLLAVWAEGVRSYNLSKLPPVPTLEFNINTRILIPCLPFTICFVIKDPRDN